MSIVVYIAPNGARVQTEPMSRPHAEAILHHLQDDPRTKPLYIINVKSVP